MLPRPMFTRRICIPYTLDRDQAGTRLLTNSNPDAGAQRVIFSPVSAPSILTVIESQSASSARCWRMREDLVCSSVRCDPGAIPLHFCIAAFAQTTSSVMINRPPFSTQGVKDSTRLCSKSS